METHLLTELIERLHNLGKTEPAPMGFGRRVERKQNPALLIIGQTSPSKVKEFLYSSNVEAVDALLLNAVPGKTATKPLKDVLWGVKTSKISHEQMDMLKDAGCELVLVDALDVHASVLRDDGIAKGIALPLDINERDAHVLDDLPFDFLTVDYTTKPGDLTVAALMIYQAAVSMVSKHIFLHVSESPEEAELERLRDLPADAVIVDLDSISDDALSTLRERVNALDARKPRSHHDEPVSAQTSSSGSDGDDHEHEHEHEDDDDDCSVEPRVSASEPPA
jgi:hypothetical protein